MYLTIDRRSEAGNYPCILPPVIAPTPCDDGSEQAARMNARAGWSAVQFNRAQISDQGSPVITAPPQPQQDVAEWDCGAANRSQRLVRAWRTTEDTWPPPIEVLPTPPGPPGDTDQPKPWITEFIRRNARVSDNVMSPPAPTTAIMPRDDYRSGSIAVGLRPLIRSAHDEFPLFLLSPIPVGPIVFQLRTMPTINFFIDAFPLVRFHLRVLPGSY